MKLQSEFSREFLKTIFSRLPPLASAARCGPHPRTPLATPLRKGKKWKFPHSQGIVEVWNKYSVKFRSCDVIEALAFMHRSEGASTVW